MHQYDVKVITERDAAKLKNPNDFNPPPGANPSPPRKERKLPPEMLRQAFRQVELLLKERNPAAYFVYDGEAIAYANVDFKGTFSNLRSSTPLDLKQTPQSQKTIV